MSTATDGMFKAVCLSGIRTCDNTGTGADPNDARLGAGGYIQVIVRPLTPFGDVLPDPRASKDPSDIDNDISTHKALWFAKSDFLFQFHSPISYGQIVNCYFDEGSIPNSDFRGLRFQEPVGIDYDESFVKLATYACEGSAKGAFGEAGSPWVLGSLTNATPEEIEKKATNYDESTTLPNKPAHKIRFDSEMHIDFVPYAKAVIFDMWDKLEASVTINSSFRTVTWQRNARIKWDAWLGEGKKVNGKWVPKNGNGTAMPYVAQPAKAGKSKHNWGVAMDFNSTIGDKTYGSKKNTGATKAEWIASGLPEIITSNGLVWGGIWSNYDPVHMHLDIPTKIRNKIVAVSKNEANRQKACKLVSTIPLA